MRSKYWYSSWRGAGFGGAIGEIVLVESSATETGSDSMIAGAIVGG